MPRPSAPRCPQSPGADARSPPAGEAAQPASPPSPGQHAGPWARVRRAGHLPGCPGRSRRPGAEARPLPLPVGAPQPASARPGLRSPPRRRAASSFGLRPPAVASPSRRGGRGTGRRLIPTWPRAGPRPRPRERGPGGGRLRGAPGRPAAGRAEIRREAEVGGRRGARLARRGAGGAGRGAGCGAAAAAGRGRGLSSCCPSPGPPRFPVSSTPVNLRVRAGGRGARYTEDCWLTLLGLGPKALILNYN